MCEMDDTKHEREDFDATTQRKVIILDVSPDAVGDVELTEDIINNTIAVIHTRLERLGTEQVTAQKVEGKNQIMVEFPEDEDSDKIRKIIQMQGKLEFLETYDASEILPLLGKLNNTLAMNNANNGVATAEANMPLGTLNTILAFGCVVGVARDTASVNAMINTAEAKKIFPSDLKLLWGAKPLIEGEPEYALYAVKTRGSNGRAPLTGECVTEAKDDFDNLGRPIISIEMNTDGAAKWSVLTENYIGHAIAIVIDGVVYSAPNVLSKIDGGKSQISGNFTHKEVKDLANVLGSGKLPLPVRIVQEYVFAR